MSHGYVQRNRLIPLVALLAFLPACNEQELESLHTQVLSLEKQTSSLEKQNLQLQQEISSLRMESSFTAKALKDKEATIAQLRAETATHLENLTKLHTQFERIQTEHSQANSQYSQTISDLRTQLAAAEQTKQKTSKKEKFAALMKALQTLNSSVETGVNANRYSELVSAARAEYASLDTELAGHPILPLIDEFIAAHQTIVEIWSQMRTSHIGSTSSTKAIISQGYERDLFEKIQKQFPAVQTESIGVAVCYVVYSNTLGSLWGCLNPLWQQITFRWQNFE